MAGADGAAEPIAIVGLGCRLPGNVSSPSALWDLLSENRSGRSEIPTSRWNAAGFYHPDSDHPGTTSSLDGYFIHGNPADFENTFFGINNLEAQSMDPQQRKLLEVVYECFENGGIPLQKVRGSNTGVYIANFTNDYMISHYQDPEQFSRYSAPGFAPTILANRITHSFDLRGPSMILDTACSGSMYALHLACQALISGDCDGAVVASANLIQSPEHQIMITKAGLLSPDSLSHTFDDRANGYARAEGVCSVYLKRLSDAQKDNDIVRAVIRATAVNGNGKTPGITQPSVAGQEAVMRLAYAKANLPTNETDYVEAHGTGTQVGDPIECESISRVFKHKSGRKTLIGGVKPSLGHCEGSSALLSLLKVVLALEHRLIPATIGVKTVNPNIRLHDWNLDIATKNQPWPETRLARASVSSFGFGGSNGHVIVESADTWQSSAPSNGITLKSGYRSQAQTITRASLDKSDDLQLILMSAGTQKSLYATKKLLASRLTSSVAAVSVDDLAYTLSSKRSLLPNRLALLTKQTTLIDTLSSENVNITSESGLDGLPFVFMYTGQGAQWPGMGKELYHRFPEFHQSITQLDEYLQDLEPDLRPDWSIKDALQSGSGVDINDASISQPICTAVQIALTDLFRSWNVSPVTVVGHSSGEIVAAYCAGHISARQALMSAFCRGLSLAAAPTNGAMVAVGCGRGRAQELLAEAQMGNLLEIACVNSPESVTLSGEEEAARSFVSMLRDRSIFVRFLKTGGKAYHSRQMEPVGKNYQSILERLWYPSAWEDPGSTVQKDPTGLPTMISTAGGVLRKSEQKFGPSYWRLNLESHVEFEPALRSILQSGTFHFIELGPHSALKLPLQQTAHSIHDSDVSFLYDSALVRGSDAVHSVLTLAGSLYCRGHTRVAYHKTVVSRSAAERKPKMLTDLPSYPWDYTNTVGCPESRSITAYRSRRFPRHELLGAQVPESTGDSILWRNTISTKELPWLEDHCLGSAVILPGAAYIAMAAEALRQTLESNLEDGPMIDMRNFTFLKPLDLSSNNKKGVEILSEIRRKSTSAVSKSQTWWDFSVSSISARDSSQFVHATAVLSADMSSVVLERQLRLDKNVLESHPMSSYYGSLAAQGLKWGPKFAIVRDIYCDRKRRNQHAVATLSALDEVSTRNYEAHPIQIDAMLQTAIVASTAGWIRNLRAIIPVSIERILIAAPSLLKGPNEDFCVDAETRWVGFGTVKLTTELYSPNGSMVMHMSGARCIPFQGFQDTSGTPDSEKRHPLVRVMWKPDITKLRKESNHAFCKCLQKSSQSFQIPFRELSDDYRRTLSLLDLAVHNNPTARILHLTDSSEESNGVLEFLRAGHPLQKFESYVCESLVKQELINEDPSLSRSNGTSSSMNNGSSYDLVIAPKMSTSTLMRVGSRLSQKTIVITPQSATLIDGEPAESPSGSQKTVERHNSSQFYINQKRDTQCMHEYPIYLINRNGIFKAFEKGIAASFSALSQTPVQCLGLAEVSDKIDLHKSLVIFSLDLEEEPFLSSMNDSELQNLRSITNQGSVFIWLTNADLLHGTRPGSALILGLARTIMLEQPALRFAIFDFDLLSEDENSVIGNLRNIAVDCIGDDSPDLEYTQKEGIVHIVRCEPDEILNQAFNRKWDEDPVDLTPSSGRSILNIAHPGQLDTLNFMRKDFTSPLRADEVEVEVKSVGMNAKDLYILSGRVDTPNITSSCEFSGTVTEVGSSVTDLKKGDRVVALADAYYATIERHPRWSMCKMEDDEEFETVSTIPLVFSTALYALKYLANLQPGESVLIHSAAGGVGIAAIQIAKSIGAEIFCTVGNDAKRAFLTEHFDIQPDHIFTSRDVSFLPSILKTTSNEGVDVVLNSLTGELLHSSLQACASFGKFIEIGKRDILDHGNLNMAAFGRSISFHAFDLSDIYRSRKPAHHRLVQKLLCESMELIRSGTAKPCHPLRVFDASNITEAFRYFSQATRMGKVAVSYQNRHSLKVLPPRFETTFDAQKAYVLIGCLGGLGRSLSRWMFYQGARNFVFLGRSATDKAAARDLVNDLKELGADVEVVRGDVVNYEDVQETLRASTLPIGGVIQAAMGLSEALWTEMTNTGWQAGIRPKVQGTWNLHNALAESGKDKHLDFFLMTSSINGTIGTATESNYCAGNAFLDAFARYRRNLNLPAVSVGLGMLSGFGYLHENPHIEALLKRRGVYALNEDEFLQVIDFALSRQSTDSTARYDLLADSHILTGMEFVGLKDHRDRGFEGDHFILNDRRTALFAAAFTRSTISHSDSHSLLKHGLPGEVASALAGQSSTTVFEAVRELVAAKISNLILLPAGKLQYEQKLGEFGLDSMLAAEFRIHLFRTLKVDVPFVTLLDRGISVDDLARLITGQLEESK